MVREALFRVGTERRGRPKPAISRKLVYQVLVCVLGVVTLLSFWFSPADTASPHGDPQPPALPQRFRSKAWECMEKESCEDVERYGAGKFSYGPSRGYFPAGCKWREVDFAAEERGPAYEFWHDAAQAWLPERPTACTLDVRSPPPPQCTVGDCVRRRLRT